MKTSQQPRFVVLFVALAATSATTGMTKCGGEQPVGGYSDYGQCLVDGNCLRETPHCQTFQVPGEQPAQMCTVGCFDDSMCPTFGAGAHCVRIAADGSFDPNATRSVCALACVTGSDCRDSETGLFCQTVAYGASALSICLP